MEPLTRRSFILVTLAVALAHNRRQQRDGYGTAQYGVSVYQR